MFVNYICIVFFIYIMCIPYFNSFVFVILYISFSYHYFFCVCKRNHANNVLEIENWKYYKQYTVITMKLTLARHVWLKCNLTQCIILDMSSVNKSRKSVKTILRGYFYSSIVCEWELVFYWQECRETEPGALTGGGFTDPAEDPKRSTWFLTAFYSSSVCSACFGLTVRGSDLFIHLPQIRPSNFHL